VADIAAIAHMAEGRRFGLSDLPVSWFAMKEQTVWPTSPGLAEALAG
jgi:hypothetical protein